MNEFVIKVKRWQEGKITLQADTLTDAEITALDLCFENPKSITWDAVMCGLGQSVDIKQVSIHDSGSTEE